MNRMRHWETRVDHEIHPFVGAWQFNHATRCGEVGCVFVVEELEQGWVFPKDLHRRAVQIPAEEVRAVASQCYVR